MNRTTRIISGIGLTAFLLPACHHQPSAHASAPHAVAVQAIRPLAKVATVTLPGRVTPRGEASVGQLSDYTITVAIPDGATPSLTVGQTVPVTLPLIHHQEARAAVRALPAGSVELSLAHQVQELSGQQVRVEIPLQGQGVFQVPFPAIYSPRGLAKRLMVVNGNRVDAREVKVIALFGDRDVLVTGSLQPSELVVVQGLDNLLPGDTVEVVK